MACMRKRVCLCCVSRLVDWLINAVVRRPPQAVRPHCTAWTSSLRLIVGGKPVRALCRFAESTFSSVEAIQRRMAEGLFPVLTDQPLVPVEPPPELAAAVGESLDLYLRGALSLD